MFGFENPDLNTLEIVKNFIVKALYESSGKEKNYEKDISEEDRDFVARNVEVEDKSDLISQPNNEKVENVEKIEDLNKEPTSQALEEKETDKTDSDLYKSFEHIDVDELQATEDFRMQDC